MRPGDHRIHRRNGEVCQSVEQEARQGPEDRYHHRVPSRRPNQRLEDVYTLTELAPLLFFPRHRPHSPAGREEIDLPEVGTGGTGDRLPIIRVRIARFVSRRRLGETVPFEVEINDLRRPAVLDPPLRRRVPALPRAAEGPDPMKTTPSLGSAGVLADW
jgi:hypothetical protein